MTKEFKYHKRRLQTSYVSTVIGITLVLYVLGLLGLIIIQAKRISDYVKENIGFSVIVKDDVKEADIFQLQKTLDAADFVKQTEYITKDKAAEQLKKDLGEDFISFLGYNPLLPSIEVKLKAQYANNDSLQIIEQRLLKNESIKEVIYQKSLVHLVNENISKLSLLLLAFGALFLFITIALINNTIRLAVYSKRFLIKSMQLVGATQGFIRKPFITKGIIQGIVAALFTIGLLVLSLYWAHKEFPELVNMKTPDNYLYLFIFVILTGIIITWISTFFAVRKYLKIKTDNLYYY
ncbi:MAG: Cell division protein FtsX [Bacteroidetes bacterium ADurb.Bin408]|nr:MAG: Cell division protein FtsX [Bacteroidetes bacterium ADurb.Bin408]